MKTPMFYKRCSQCDLRLQINKIHNLSKRTVYEYKCPNCGEVQSYGYKTEDELIEAQAKDQIEEMLR